MHEQNILRGLIKSVAMGEVTILLHFNACQR